MLTDLLNSSYFALFLIVALGFMLGKNQDQGAIARCVGGHLYCFTFPDILV